MVLEVVFPIPDSPKRNAVSTELIIPITRSGSQQPSSNDTSAHTTTSSSTSNNKNERVIPINRTSSTSLEINLTKTKPSLPVKPATTNRSPPGGSSPTSPTSPTSHTVRSPGLVQSCLRDQEEREQNRKIPEPPQPIEQPLLSVQEEDEVIEEEEGPLPEDELVDPYEGVGGVHERTLLGTIIEEDNESNASGSHLNLAKISAQNVEKKEARDGHYFIKVNRKFK